jgi:hypothetical protein
MDMSATRAFSARLPVSSRFILNFASVLLLTPLLPGVTTVQAQGNVSDSDLVSLTGQIIPLPTSGLDFTITVNIDTRTPNIASFVIPLSFAGHPDLEIDTTIIEAATGNKGITYSSPLGDQPFWVQRTVQIDNINKTILIGFVSFSTGLAPSQGPLCDIHFHLPATSQPGGGPIDTLLLPPTNFLSFATTSAAEYVPQYSAGFICIGNDGDGDGFGNPGFPVQGMPTAMVS